MLRLAEGKTKLEIHCRQHHKIVTSVSKYMASDSMENKFRSFAEFSMFFSSGAYKNITIFMGSYLNSFGQFPGNLFEADRTCSIVILFCYSLSFLLRKQNNSFK